MPWSRSRSTCWAAVERVASRHRSPRGEHGCNAFFLELSRLREEARVAGRIRTSHAFERPPSRGSGESTVVDRMGRGGHWKNRFGAKLEAIFPRTVCAPERAAPVVVVTAQADHGRAARIPELIHDGSECCDHGEGCLVPQVRQQVQCSCRSSGMSALTRAPMKSRAACAIDLFSERSADLIGRRRWTPPARSRWPWRRRDSCAVGPRSSSSSRSRCTVMTLMLNARAERFDAHRAFFPCTVLPRVARCEAVCRLPRDSDPDR